MEQEVGGSSPPNCTSKNNNLAQIVIAPASVGVDTGVDRRMSAREITAEARGYTAVAQEWFALSPQIRLAGDALAAIFAGVGWTLAHRLRLRGVADAVCQHLAPTQPWSLWGIGIVQDE